VADDGDWRRGVVEHLLADRTQAQTAETARSSGTHDNEPGSPGCGNLVVFIDLARP